MNNSYFDISRKRSGNMTTVQLSQDQLNANKRMSPLKSSLKLNKGQSALHKSISWKISHADIFSTEPLPTDAILDTTPWECLPASAKSMRTRNPVSLHGKVEESCFELDVPARKIR